MGQAGARRFSRAGHYRERDQDMSFDDSRPSVSTRFLNHPATRKAVAACISGLGGFTTIYLLAQVSASLDAVLLIAPFGASCVLVFAIPQSPLAQPRNVIGGHVISAFVGLAVLSLLGASPLSYALAVGLAIAAMQLTGTLHPPAGADPIVVLLAGAGWPFLLTPILAGTVLIVFVALIYHRWISGRPYPHR
jgi:CBS-domain-containing membrane protein